MDYTPAPLLQAAEQFARLPGIGMKTAQRLAYHILSLPVESVREFVDGIAMARQTVCFCNNCQNFMGRNETPEMHEAQEARFLCPICREIQRRDHSIICVVESPKDVSVFERSGGYNGVYHVLHGLISPMDGVRPEDISVRELMARLSGNIDEVIMATNPTVEGEATAAYIGRLVKAVGVKVTRLAYGLPAGAMLEFADNVTLTRALENRNEL